MKTMKTSNHEKALPKTNQKYQKVLLNIRLLVKK